MATWGRFAFVEKCKDDGWSLPDSQAVKILVTFSKRKFQLVFPCSRNQFAVLSKKYNQGDRNMHQPTFRRFTAPHQPFGQPVKANAVTS
jgi:hypothetical protein